MDTAKAEFKRLIELMGWTQSEAARRLHNTPSAVNHLINPDHRNTPTRTMMQLLKLIIASERPDLINAQTFELKAAAPGTVHLNPRERKMMEGMKNLPLDEKEKLYLIIEVFLWGKRRTGAKRKI